MVFGAGLAGSTVVGVSIHRLADYDIAPNPAILTPELPPVIRFSRPGDTAGYHPLLRGFSRTEGAAR
jgi:hypothetical protein